MVIFGGSAAGPGLSEDKNCYVQGKLIMLSFHMLISCRCFCCIARKFMRAVKKLDF